MLFFTFRLLKKIVDLIVDGNLSYNFAQLPALRMLLETVSGRSVKMPTRYKIASTMNLTFENVKLKLIKLLELQKYVCVTADVWTSHVQSYLGVTIHFLNQQYQRESYLFIYLVFMSTKETGRQYHNFYNNLFLNECLNILCLKVNQNTWKLYISRFQ